MLPFSVVSNTKSHFSRWLCTVCAAALAAVVSVGACSVPDFQFPEATGGSGVLPADHCRNAQVDGELGETDLDCGGDACGSCAAGAKCGETRDCQSRVCEGGVCLSPTCDDQVVNGDETGLDCGGPCPPCPADEPCLSAKDCASAECSEGFCGSECSDGFANCDGDNENACEVNTRRDLDNCGACGSACELPQATAECSTGECRIVEDGCAPGYLDCNGMPDDGCEIDARSNRLHCGACNEACPDINGTPSCVSGLCAITCREGFADCDDDRANGCEVNLLSNVKSCGDCAEVCGAAPGNSANCKGGVCGETQCPAGKADCSDEGPDTCETNTTSDVMNCGGCGLACVAKDADVACVKGQCVITSCKSGFADCTLDFANGCETDTTTSTAHCGGCNNACVVANGSARCEGGSCEVSSCSSTYRDCDGDPKTGCEVNVATSAKSCGGCGAAGSDCTTKYPNASSSCSGGACTAPTCAAGFGDCSGGAADGCETSTASDKNNCGACGVVCGTQNVSATACSAGVCSPTCAPGWGVCATPELGCITALGTTSNCSRCGERCSGATPFCDPGGCVGFRSIAVVDAGRAQAVAGFTGGSGGASTLSVDHTLGSARGSSRIVLVGVVASEVMLDPEQIVVTYDGTTMIPAVERTEPNKQAYSGIYYLLDAALPSSAGAVSVVRAQFSTTGSWGHGGIDVLELRNAMQVGPIATGAASSADCAGTSSRSVNVTFSQPGSLVYGVMSARAATSVSLTSSSGLVQTWNQRQATPAGHVGAAAYVFDADDRAITWNVTGCYNTSATSVAIKRLSAN